MTEELLKVPWYLRLLNNAADQESPEAEAIRHIKKQADTIEALQAEVSNLGEGMRACHENYCEAAADRDRYREALQEFVDRCDKGEVRSRYTYGKFKELLALNPPSTSEPRCDDCGYGKQFAGRDGDSEIWRCPRCDLADVLAERDRYREALDNTAKQHLPHEMDDDPDDADYEGAYIALVTLARQAIKESD